MRYAADGQLYYIARAKLSWLGWLDVSTAEVQRHCSVVRFGCAVVHNVDKDSCFTR